MEFKTALKNIHEAKDSLSKRKRLLSLFKKVNEAEEKTADLGFSAQILTKTIWHWISPDGKYVFTENKDGSWSIYDMINRVFLLDNEDFEVAFEKAREIAKKSGQTSLLIKPRYKPT